LLVAGRQQIRLHEYLEPVADSQDQLARVAEGGKLAREMMLQLVPQDSPRRDIVSIRESTRNTKHLIIRESLRRLEQPIHMPAIGHTAGELECVRSLLVAIRARRSQN
jgi:hypothetical protein